MTSGEGTLFNAEYYTCVDLLVTSSVANKMWRNGTSLIKMCVVVLWEGSEIILIHNVRVFFLFFMIVRICIAVVTVKNASIFIRKLLTLIEATFERFLGTRIGHLNSGLIVYNLELYSVHVYSENIRDIRTRRNLKILDRRLKLFM